MDTGWTSARCARRASAAGLTCGAHRLSSSAWRVINSRSVGCPRCLSPAPARCRELGAALPDRPFAVAFWDGTAAGPTTAARRSRDRASARRRPSRTRCARPASSASAGRTSPARSRSTTSTTCSRCSTPGAAGARPPRQARLALAAVRGGGLTRPPPAPRRPSCGPRGRRHSLEPRRARGAPPLRRLQRVLRALPRRVDDLQLRVLLARREHARGGAGGQARAGLHEARPRAGRARARRGLRLGRLRDARRRALRRRGRGDHAVRAAGRARAPARAPRPGWPSASRSGSMDYRELPASAFDAIASIGMVEHVGGEQIDVYAAQLAALLRPAGGCSTTASRGCATATRRPGRSPSATCSPTPSRCTSRGCSLALERAGLRHRRTSRASARTTPRRCATGPAPGRSSRRGRSARGRGAGARLAALPARGAQRLRAGSRRSTRCSARGRGPASRAA